MSRRLPSLASWSCNTFSRFLDACSTGLRSLLWPGRWPLAVRPARAKKRKLDFYPQFELLEVRTVPTAWSAPYGDSVAAGDTALFCFAISDGVPGTATVDHTTEDFSGDSRSAHVGVDYTYESGTLTFTSDHTITYDEGAIANLSPTIDHLWDPPLHFKIQLSNPVNSTIGSPSYATVYITYDLNVTTTLLTPPSGLASGSISTKTITEDCGCGYDALKLIYQQPQELIFESVVGAANDTTPTISQTLTIDDTPRPTIMSTPRWVSGQGYVVFLVATEPLEGAGPHNWAITTEVESRGYTTSVVTTDTPTMAGVQGSFGRGWSYSGMDSFYSDGPKAAVMQAIVEAEGGPVNPGTGSDPYADAGAANSVPVSSQTSPDPHIVGIQSDSGGVFVHTDNDGTSYFTKNMDGSYTSPPGYTGTLQASGTSFTYTDAHQNVSTFNSGGKLQSTKNANNQGTSYDNSGSGGLLADLTEVDGTAISFTYSYIDTPEFPSGYPFYDTITGPNGIFTLTHDSHGNLTEVQGSDGTSNVFTYDTLDRMLTSTWGTSAATYLFDSTYGLLSGEVFNGHTYTINPGIVDELNAFPSSFSGPYVAKVTDPLGNLTTYTLNKDSGRVVSITTPPGDPSYLYNSNGQPTQVTDNLGRITTYTYDAAGDITSVKAPDSTITTYTYDPTFHLVTTKTDPLARVTTFTYDSTGDLVSIKNPLGATTSYAWTTSQPPSPLIPPSLANPGTVINFVEDDVSLQLAATDPMGVPLLYQAAGLPTGLSVSSTGLIYGTISDSNSPGDFLATVSVTDGVSTAVQTFTYTVDAAAVAATHFQVAAVATSVPKGSPLTFTVTALDGSGLLAKSYLGTVHITSSDTAVLPSDTTLVNGVGTFTITLNPGGSLPLTQTITATDTHDSGVNGTSASITVTSTGTSLDHFMVTAPSSVTAGVPFPVVVTAVNGSGGVATGYTGTVHFTSLDPLALIPISDTTLTAGVGTFMATLRTATPSGSWTIVAADAGSPGATAASGNVMVTPQAATHFTVSAPATGATGYSFNVTVTALDPFDNIAPAYSGTVHFSSSDGSATLPSNTTLTSGVSTFKATLATSGNQTITVADASSTNPTITGTSNPIVIRGLIVTYFMPTPTGFMATFYKPFVPGDVKLDDSNLTTVDDVTMRAPTPVGNIHGSLVIDPTDQSITFIATASYLQLLNSGISGNSSSVLPDATYTVTLVSGSGANGFLDALGAHLDGANNGGTSNYVTTFATTFQADSRPVLGVPDFNRGPGGYSITGATEDGSNVVTITTAIATNIQIGSQVVVSGITPSRFDGTFTVVDTPTANTFTYTTSAGATTGSLASALVYQDIQVPSGSAYGIPVTLYDYSNVTDVTFSLTYDPTLFTLGGTLYGSSSDATDASATFTLVSNSGGTATFHYFASSPTTAAPDSPLVLGDLMAYVPNSAASFYKADQIFRLGNIIINFADSTATRAVAAFTIQVNSYFGDVNADGVIDGADKTAANSVATGSATGFVAFQQFDPVIVGDVAGDTSVDASDVSTIDAYVTGLGPLQIPVPPGVSKTNESATDPVYLANPGNQSNFLGDSTSVQLAATELTAATMTYSASGLPTGLNVSSTGLIYGTVTTSDTPGDYAVTVTVINGASTASQNIIWTVNSVPGAATHFLISPVATSVPKSSPLTFTVTALDAGGLLAKSYAGTVHFTSTDTGATLPSNATLTNGVGSFAITFGPTSTPSSQTITATDTITGSINGTSASVTVSSTGGNSVDHFVVSAPSNVTAGLPFAITVTAYDSGNAVVTGDTGSVTFSSTLSGGGGVSVLPSTTTLTGGVGSFLVTLKTATRGTYWTLTATQSGHTGTSGYIAVQPAAASYLTVTTPSPINTTQAFNVTVTALDAYGNTATGYAGTVHFTSSDGAATLPPDAMLASGVGIFSAVFNTAGSRTITATDNLAADPVITGKSSTITVNNLRLTVTSFTPTPNGFVIALSRPLNPADVVLYAANTSTTNDVTLHGASVGYIPGTLVVDSTNMIITFKATANYLAHLNSTATTPTASTVLPDDTYTVTLVSGSAGNGFFDLLGTALDGANNGGTSNFSTSFTTIYQSGSLPVLGVADFARPRWQQRRQGPQQHRPWYSGHHLQPVQCRRRHLRAPLQPGLAQHHRHPLWRQQ